MDFGADHVIATKRSIQMHRPKITNIATQNIYSSTNTIAQATRYLSKGFAPIPVRYMEKTPTLPKWQHSMLCENDLPKHFGATPCNIGVVLGARSNGLVDIDIDDDTALKLAVYFLPSTELIFGRSSRPKSHWIYRSNAAKPKKLNDHLGHVLVEMRGDNQHTVFPGSVHPSGEAVRFDVDGDPATAEYEQLESACMKICIGTLLLRHWRSGSRHELALATAGMLAKANWKEDEALKLIEVVAREASDQEEADRRNCVIKTYERFAAGEAVQWRTRLAELLGKEAADKLASWARAGIEADMTVPLSPAATATADISTDTRAAKTFAGLYKDKIIYCDGPNNWFRKANEVYRPISPVQIQGVATKFALDISAQIAGRLPGGIQARNLESRRRINGFIELSRSKLRVDWSALDTERNLIGLGDGTVFDLGLLQQRPRSQAIVTKCAGASFEPEADCPTWSKFLNRIFAEDQEVISFVQRAVGYTLSGDVGEQCLFLLTGTGANGKSTFINALNHLFGDYAAAIPMHTLMLQRNGNEQTNDLAQLPGKRFVTASEGEQGQRLAESRIKVMTGGDKVSCRMLYQEYFSFDPQFKLWLATNSLPKIGGVDEAIWRRIKVIRFPVTIPVEERDADLGHVLQSELPGILNWALQGYRDWKQQKLNPPDQVKNETDQYRLENDLVGQFIEACCDTTPRAVTAAKELYDRYVLWSEHSGYEPMHRSPFGKTLAQKDFVKVPKSTGNAWKGLALKAA